MLMTKPEFMENEDWYYKDIENPIYKEEDVICFRLTDKAPKEAVESYLEFCNNLYRYNLGYIPEFVIEEYRKHMQRFL